MTIAEQLIKINDAKTGIKNAIEAKGVTVGDAPLAEYAGKIAAIEGGGGGETSRYGLSIDNFLPVVENGTIKGRYMPKEIVFSGIKEVAGDGFQYMCYNMVPHPEGTNCVFPDLVTLKTNRALEYFFSMGESLSTSPGLSVSFPSLETISAWYGLSYFAYRGRVTRVSFPALKRLEMSYVFNSGFRVCGALETIEFPLLENTHTAGFSSAFSSSGLETFEFPSLQTVEDQGLSGAFDSCLKLQTAKLPSLKTVESSGMKGAFSGCVELKEVDISSLSSVGAQGMASCFQVPSSKPGVLERIDFPALVDVDSTAFGTAASSYIFRHRTTLEEIHFRADMQATIEAMSGYADKWGATNATIYFDL